MVLYSCNERLSDSAQLCYGIINLIFDNPESCHMSLSTAKRVLEYIK